VAFWGKGGEDWRVGTGLCSSQSESPFEKQWLILMCIWLVVVVYDLGFRFDIPSPMYLLTKRFI
jgi:hypothetical protein